MTRPDDWNQKVIEEFRAHEGRVGGPFAGAPMILVHHIGARSGTERVTPRVYFPEDDRMVVVASQGREREEIWSRVVAANPGFGEYQQRA
jgi:deazaflavin-dependent oxidoreductase (nitroreductase family)